VDGRKKNRNIYPKKETIMAATAEKSSSFSHENNANCILQTNNGKTFIGYNIAHQKSRPVSSLPAVRLLGTYHSAEDLKDHFFSPSKEGRKKDSMDSTLLVGSIGSFFPILMNTDHYDVKRAKIHTDALLRLHQEKQKQHHADFHHRVKNKLSLTDEKSNTMMQREHELRKCRKKAKRLERSLEKVKGAQSDPSSRTNRRKARKKFANNLTNGDKVEGDEYAVISIVFDHRKNIKKDRSNAEPLVCVLGVFPDEKSAREHATKSNGCALMEMSRGAPLYIVPLYRWLFVESILPEDIPSMHPDNPKLQSIIDASRENKNQAWMKQNDNGEEKKQDQQDQNHKDASVVQDQKVQNAL